MIKRLLPALIALAISTPADAHTYFAKKTGGGPFSPSDLSCAVLYLESDDTTVNHTNTGCTTNVTTSGDNEQCWEDQSPSGWDFTEGTNFPTWGDPGIDFAGSDYLTASPSASEDETHLFIVWEMNSTANFSRLFSAYNTSGTGGVTDVANDDGLSIDLRFGTTLTFTHDNAGSRNLEIVNSSLSNNTIYLTEIYIDWINGTAEMWTDGVSDGTDTATGGSAWSPDTLRIGANAHAGGDGLTGTVYAAFACDAQVTGTDLTNLRTHLDGYKP